MSTKRSDPSGLSRAIADLEAVDKQLSDLAGKSLSAGTTDSIAESRALVHGAIHILTLGQQAALAAAANITEEPATTKRRVKIKAESQETEAAPRAGARGKTSAKGTPPKDDPTPAQSAPGHSLLARLGAAASEPTEPSPAPATPAINTLAPTPVTAEKPARQTADASILDTTARLARLEAEIAGLTDMHLITEAPPGATSRAAAREVARSDDAVEDDDDTEIVIVSPDNTSSRTMPRMFRDAPSSGEDEAEVEIHRPDADGATAPTPKVGARMSNPPERPAAGSRWRLFRGSS